LKFNLERLDREIIITVQVIGQKLGSFLTTNAEALIDATTGTKTTEHPFSVILRIWLNPKEMVILVITEGSRNPNGVGCSQKQNG